eukprot:83555-Ditylum_brightwellii.AAC.1
MTLRKKESTGSAADIDPSTQEEETHHYTSPPFVPFQDNSPLLFTDKIQTDMQAPIDASSANIRIWPRESFPSCIIRAPYINVPHRNKVLSSCFKTAT